MRNGMPYPDTSGEPIHAHGGWILRHENYWYWYGEDRRGDAFVSCYRSTDLEHWENRGVVLHADSASEIAPGRGCPLRRPGTDAKDENKGLSVRPASSGKANIERPKVLYCRETGRFVMWAHYENGVNYNDACACVAVCDTPDGQFVYKGGFRPFGNMSRDCTVFTDTDGTSYFLSASNENRDLKVYRLTKDCEDAEAEVMTLFEGQSREAPAVFVKDGRYFLLSSRCTGWKPNQGGYAYADSFLGPWSPIADFGDETTYRSQPAFVLTLEGMPYYVGDRWMGGGAAYFTSTYVALPIRFDGNGMPYIRYADSPAE